MDSSEIRNPSHASSCRCDRAILGLLLSLHVAMLAWGAYRHSPTVDEPAYLVGGISHWRFGRFDLTKVSPPLVRLVSAIPVILTPHSEDWGSYRIGPGVRSEHPVGADFIAANGHGAFWLFAIGRWACIPFSLVGAYTCFRWSRELWGRRAGWFAVLLWCFSPNVLAHGQMLTPDIGVMSLSLAASYLYWRWSRSPTWTGTALMGAALGLALLAKTNAVVLFAVLPCVAFISAVSHSRQKARCKTTDSTALDNDVSSQIVVAPRLKNELRRDIVQLMVSVFVAIYVVNLGYGFEGSLEPLGRYEFASRTFRGLITETIGNRFRGNICCQIPVPFPKAFLEGIDLQRRDFENGAGTTMTYWRGTWYTHGWWWYYLYASAIKEPLGAWVLLFASCGIQTFGTRRRLQKRLQESSYPISSPEPPRNPESQTTLIGTICWATRSWLNPDILCVVLPGIALFAIASSQTGFGHALRYVLPAFPFAFVFASGAVRDTVHSRRVLRILAVALSCHVAGSIMAWPHSLSYFNELAGGPRNGHAHLLDGNLDWGQDLLYLERWVSAHPEARPLHVGYWGFIPLDRVMPGNFSEFDFEAKSFSGGTESPLPSGWYAISVNNLRQDFRMGKAKYATFLDRRPVDMAGYSIYIYKL